MRAFVRVGIIIVLLGFALAPLSCNRAKPADKSKAGQTEAYRQSLYESKKVIVAKVNGAGISMYDLVSEMNAITPRYLQKGQPRDPGLDEKVRKDALDRLISRELAFQEAVKQGMSAQEQADQQLKAIKADLKSEDAYMQKLAETGLTEKELKSRIEKNILVEMIAKKEIFDKVKIDPKLVEKTYAKEKALYKGPSGQMSFEEAKPDIEKKLMTAAVQKREDEWTGNLKKGAKIEIDLDQFAKAIQPVAH